MTPVTAILYSKRIETYARMAMIDTLEGEQRGVGDVAAPLRTDRRDLHVGARDLDRSEAVALASFSARVVDVSVERMMNPFGVDCGCSLDRCPPASPRCARRRTVAAFAPVSVITVPPLNSMPRFRPRNTRAPIAMTSTMPESANIHLRYAHEVDVGPMHRSPPPFKPKKAGALATTDVGEQHHHRPREQHARW